MTVPLSQQERTRLAKLLGMLGSNHSGERDAAGLAAHRLVMNAGMTWQDVLTPQVEHHRRKPEPEPDWPPPRPTNAYASWRRTVASLLSRTELLTAWEAGFLHSINERFSLSERQFEVLEDIVERVALRHAAAARRTGGAA
ncbi:MAG: hypothetical protein ACJ8AI_28480 [Rhodopila sp.]